MNKPIDLTGLSRAITNIEEWVLGQRTHYGVEKTFYAADIARLSGTLSFEGYANYALIDIVLSGLETTLKLNRHGNKAYSYVQSYNNYKVDLYLDWKEDYTQFGYTDISWEIRVEDNFPLHVEDFENIKIVVPQKLLPEIYIPDTIARTEQVEQIREETTALWENLDHGTFPNLTAGDLAGRGESVPAEFGFRASGGKSIKDGRAYIKSIKGNSVVWNNIAEWRGSGSIYKGITVTYEGGKIHVQGTPEEMEIAFYSLFFDDVATPPRFKKNHYYLIRGASEHFELAVLGNVSVLGSNCITQKTGDAMRVYLVGSNLTVGQEVNESFSAQVIDLTQMFQAGNEPTTIEEYNARKPIVDDEYAYNEGEVIHMNTEGIKSVGDNAWDEEWGMGRLSTITGQVNAGNNGIYSKNYIKVLPNETYYCGYNDAPIFAMFYDAEYALITGVNGSNNFVSIRNTQFTTPENAAYMRFYIVDITTYNNDICIRLAHTGYKTDYEPYWQDTLPLPIIRKYFPDGMVGGTDASGNRGGDIIYYDKASKKWYAQTNMLLLNLDMSNVGVQASNIADYTTFLIHADNANQCKTYGAGAMFNNYGLQTDTYYGPRRIYTTWDNKVSISIPSTMASDVGELQALYQQMPLIVYAELAEPIVTELDAEDQNFRDYYNVADFGTEEAIPATDAEGNIIPSAPFSADIIYQFNAVDLIREHELEITELQKVIETMQAQLTSLINGGQ